MPRAEDLPDDIRDLVLYQKHDVTHERFGRDVSDLLEAIDAAHERFMQRVLDKIAAFEMMCSAGNVVETPHFGGSTAIASRFGDTTFERPPVL